MTCKWISDNYSEVCTNAECPVCGDFCPLANYPSICTYFAEGGAEKRMAGQKKPGGFRMAISVSEFADMIGVSKPKAYDIIRRDDFRGVFKVDKRTLISVPRALEWVEAQAARGEKP